MHQTYFGLKKKKWSTESFVGDDPLGYKPVCYEMFDSRCFVQTSFLSMLYILFNPETLIVRQPHQFHTNLREDVRKVKIHTGGGGVYWYNWLNLFIYYQKLYLWKTLIESFWKPTLNTKKQRLIKIFLEIVNRIRKNIRRRLVY